MSDLGPNLSLRLLAVMANLVIDAAAAEVLAAFGEAGILGVILKGPALADWYPETTRTYVDADIWIAPQSRARASELLRSRGFEHVEEAEMTGELPEWWANHATTWARHDDRAKIDLHHRLQGFRRPPEDVWASLSPLAESFTLAGQQARRLHQPARALYVALHAAAHGAGEPGAQLHLHAALAAVEESTWQQASEIARELDATDMFSAGLRLLEDGAALADRLGLPAVNSVETALYTMTPPPVAFGFEELASTSGLQGRVRLLARKLFPAPSFVRHWWPPAGRNRVMLAVGYVYRPLWILRHAPSGWRAWQRARKQVDDQERAASSSR